LHTCQNDLVAGDDAFAAGDVDPLFEVVMNALAGT
jgi:hypothetical protein